MAREFGYQVARDERVLAWEERRAGRAQAKTLRRPAPGGNLFRPLDEMPKTSKAVQAAEKKLGKNGRVVVRWSGTEPKLRVMIEGENEKAIEALARSITDAATAELA